MLNMTMTPLKATYSINSGLYISKVDNHTYFTDGHYQYAVIYKKSWKYLFLYTKKCEINACAIRSRKRGSRAINNTGFINKETQACNKNVRLNCHSPFSFFLEGPFFSKQHTQLIMASLIYKLVYIVRKLLGLINH